jgi:hypothetical protein
MQRSVKYDLILWVRILLIMLIVTVPFGTTFAQELKKPTNTETQATEPGVIGGMLGGLWDGLVTVTTLGGLFDDEDDEEPKPATTASSWNSGVHKDSTSSMSRMMDRMSGLVANQTYEEDEFGLPK